jgi:hypothetical protein
MMESLFWIFPVLFPIALALLLVFVLAFLVGVVLVIFQRFRPQSIRWIPRAYPLVLVLVGVLPFACLALMALPSIIRTAGSVVRGELYWPRCTTVDDETMLPFINAREAAGAEQYGFTPLEPDARVEIHRIAGDKAAHDVVLHIYGSTSRTIAYKEVGDSFVWLGEQEIHRGPGEFLSEGFKRKEEIVITYETVYLSGAPPNQVYVTYTGENPTHGNRVLVGGEYPARGTRQPQSSVRPSAQGGQRAQRCSQRATPGERRRRPGLVALPR